MKIATPLQDHEIDIPDEWWEFCEMNTEYTRVGEFYPYPQCFENNTEVIDIQDIQPIVRAVGTNGFRKYKMVPVLMAFRDPEGLLPPIEVGALKNDPKYRYKLENGFHRYYASLAVGYSRISVQVKSE